MHRLPTVLSWLVSSQERSPWARWFSQRIWRPPLSQTTGRPTYMRWIQPGGEAVHQRLAPVSGTFNVSESRTLRRVWRCKLLRRCANGRGLNSMLEYEAPPLKLAAELRWRSETHQRLRWVLQTWCACACACASAVVFLLGSGWRQNGIGGGGTVSGCGSGGMRLCGSWLAIIRMLFLKKMKMSKRREFR
ncbi:hypothetical protein GGI35DRAFT_173698 [Trichoderma velutinum]